jgi:CheY-like chemotaxis protein
MHGGTVTAHSEGAGKGTELEVRLPLVPGTAMTTAADKTQTLELPELPSRRILVVDDNNDAAETLAAMLRVSGHQVETAGDGLQALTVAPSFAPDVVLLDLGMPNLNGYETATRIRAQPWGRHVALIAITGWGQPEDRQRTVEAGFNAHLVKPVDRIELLNTLVASLKRDAFSAPPES